MRNAHVVLSFDLPSSFSALPLLLHVNPYFSLSLSLSLFRSAAIRVCAGFGKILFGQVSLRPLRLPLRRQASFLTWSFVILTRIKDNLEMELKYLFERKLFFFPIVSQFSFQ